MKKHTQALVRSYNTDLCLLLLWHAVYSGTDNINVLQLAVILHEDTLLTAAQLISMLVQ